MHKIFLVIFGFLYMKILVCYFFLIFVIMMINYLKGRFNKILKIISLCYTKKFLNILLLGIVQEILSF